MTDWSSKDLTNRKRFFEVVANTAHMQVATMFLFAGQKSGEYGTDHPHADQLLVVLSGSGIAQVEGTRIDLNAGDVLLIEAGERHQIIGSSEGPMSSISVYAPVAYPEEAPSTR
jgi:quercetin dioxygenase-like cupin family protein